MGCVRGLYYFVIYTQSYCPQSIVSVLAGPALRPAFFGAVIGSSAASTGATRLAGREDAFGFTGRFAGFAGSVGGAAASSPAVAHNPFASSSSVLLTRACVRYDDFLTLTAVGAAAGRLDVRLLARGGGGLRVALTGLGATLPSP